MKVCRRDFLKTMGVLGVGSLTFNPVLNAFASGEARKRGVGTWYASTCQGCTTWCPIEILVQNGRAVKVRGNQNSLVNPGTVCPRGHLIPQEMYDPDRLKTPMKRTNTKKGRSENPQFVPITWDEAMTTIATQLLALRNNNEPEKLLYLRGRYSFSTDIQYTSFMKIFGSPNKVSHSTICAESEKNGPYYTEAFWGYRDYDMDNCKYLLLWGVDPFRSNRQVPGSMARFAKIKKNGKITVIDPLLTTSAAKANIWAPVKPGEDGALASAIAHHILVSGGWSKEFVGDFNDSTNKFIANNIVNEADFTEIKTHGIVKWWNLELKDKTPEWAADICGISKSMIIKIANEMIEAAPNVSVWLGPGPVMSPRGLYTSMAIHALNGLLGSVENDGGPCRNPSVPTAANPSESTFIDAIATAGNAKKKIGSSGKINFPGISGSSGYGKAAITNEIATAINADPTSVKVCIANWCNFNFSCTDTKRWDEALSKIPFLVHITTNASETSHFADILLPSTHPSVERYSYLKTNGNLHSEATIQQPLADRLFDVRSDENEITFMLAEKLSELGFTNLLDYLKTWKDPDTSAVPTNYTEFAEYSTKLYLKPIYSTLSGGWDEFKTKGIKSYLPVAKKAHWDDFKTSTKKFEFYSETLKARLQELATKLGGSTTIDQILSQCNYLANGDLGFVPHYEPPLRHGDVTSYPFTFIDVKSRYNREGRSANLPFYYQFKKLDPGDDNWSDVIKINPIDATTNGFSDGDLVKVTSIAGEIKCRLKIWEGVRPGYVAKSYGQGHWSYGRFASKDFANGVPNGGNNNEILVEDYERISGSTARNGGFTGVKITKV